MLCSSGQPEMVLPAGGEAGTAGEIARPGGSAAAGLWDSLAAFLCQGPGSPLGSGRAPVPTPDLLRSPEAPSRLVLLGVLPLVLRQEMDGPPLEQRSPSPSDRRSKAAGGRRAESCLRERYESTGSSLLRSGRPSWLHVWVGSWAVKREWCLPPPRPPR